jgi:excisionase family DNA binding protein
MTNKTSEKMAVTPSEAMDLTSIGKNSIYAALNCGELKGKRIGQKKWVIPMKELQRWIEEK